MGCDIHAMIERRHPEESSEEHWHWLNAGDPDINRNYALFGLLAGVRSTDPRPISMDRGLPDDVSFEFRDHADAWSGDAHSHGWVTLRELHEYQHEPGYAKRDLDLLIGEMERVALRYDGDPDAVRLVFFFDN